MSLAPPTASVPTPGRPVTIDRILAAPSLFGAPDALFAFKSFLSAMLAYWIALRIGLERPSWAVITCLIVAQPLAGAVLSKALFRLCGTAIGAGVAVLLVPTLVDAPELLCLALALWLGLCTYLGVLDRTPRSYLFLLAGYSASIVGFPAVSTPAAIFDIAAIRVQEIGIGIIVSAAVHALIFPRGIAAQLSAQIGTMIADAEALSTTILRHRDEQTIRQRPTLVQDIAALDILAVHLPYDLSRLPLRRKLLHALQHQLAETLANGSAVEDRLRRLRGRLPDAMARLVEDVATWLDDQPTGDPDMLLARARAMEPTPASIATLDEALRLSLLDRMRLLIDAHSAVRRLGAAIGSRDERALAEVAELVRGAPAPGRHRDRVGALLGAAATMIATLAGCVAWIATAWPDGANAVVYAAIICALFSNLENPGPTARTVLFGVAAGAAGAFILRFAVMPQVTDYIVLTAVLAPAFLLLSTASQSPGLGGFAIGAILALPGLAGFEDRYNPDFANFANAACAELVGAGIAAIALGLVRSIGQSSRARRLTTAARQSLDRKIRSPKRQAPEWTGTMLDRIGLLSAGREDAGAHILSVLRLLRLGRAVDSLRQLAGQHASQGAMVDLLIRHLRRALADPDRISHAQRSFSRMLARLARDQAPSVRREAVLAVVALICNLPDGGGRGTAIETITTP